MQEQHEEEREFYTIEQAAKAAGLHRTTVYRLIREGKLSVVIDGAKGKKLIDRAQLEQACGPLSGSSQAKSAASSYESSGVSRREVYSPATAELIQLLQLQVQEGKEREAWLKQRLEAAEAAGRELARALPQPSKDASPKATDWVTVAVMGVWVAVTGWVIWLLAA